MNIKNFIIIVVLVGLIIAILFYFNKNNSDLVSVTPEYKDKNISEEKNIKDIKKPTQREKSVVFEYGNNKNIVKGENGLYDNKKRASVLDSLSKVAQSRENMDEYKSSIRNTIEILKNSIEEENITPKEKAKRIYQLSTMYCEYGRDPFVLENVYTGEYKKFYQKGDLSKTSRDFLIHGYEVYPTARAASNISHSFIKDLLTWQLYGKNDKFDKNKKEYLENAKFYIEKADELAKNEKFSKYKRYAQYKMWSLFAKAGYNLIDPNEYVNYKEEYNLFIADLKKNILKHHESTMFLRTTLVQYSYFLLNSKNTEKNEVDKLIGEFIKYDKIDKNGTVRFMDRFYKRQKGDYNLDIVEYVFIYLIKNNELFKKYVIGTNPELLNLTKIKFKN